MESKNKSVLTQVAILSISFLLTSATSIAGALPMMKKSVDMTYTQAELIMTVPALAVVIFVLLSSYLTNRFGMKKIIQVGLVLVGVAGTAPLFLNQFSFILISRFLLGAGFGLYNASAVSLINVLYKEEHKKRALLLGYRGAIENLGNASLAVLSGILLAYGWHFSFAIYLLAFPILILFTWAVPDISIPKKAKLQKVEATQKNSIPIQVYLSTLLAAFSVMVFIGTGVRFPSLVETMKGEEFNASKFIALMPIISMISGLFFGILNQWLKRKVLYLGLLIMLLSTVLVGFSEGNFTLLLIGYFICGVPVSLIVSFMFNALDQYVSLSQLNIATAIILVGCNLGAFLSPFGLKFLEDIIHTKNLFVPFKLFALLTIVIAIGMAIREKWFLMED